MECADPGSEYCEKTRITHDTNAELCEDCVQSISAEEFVRYVQPQEFQGSAYLLDLPLQLELSRRIFENFRDLDMAQIINALTWRDLLLPGHYHNSILSFCHDAVGALFWESQREGTPISVKGRVIMYQLEQLVRMRTLIRSHRIHCQRFYEENPGILLNQILVDVDLEALDTADRKCAICREPYGDQEGAVRLRCQGRHVLGKECVKRWIRDGGTTCPFDREAVLNVLTNQEWDDEPEWYALMTKGIEDIECLSALRRFFGLASLSHL